MIGLRRKLERGLAHPVLGPIVLIVLILVLAMVYLHAPHDGHESATEVGLLGIAIVMFLGPALIGLLRRRAPAPAVMLRGDRGPPRLLQRIWVLRPAIVAGSHPLPLRR